RDEEIALILERQRDGVPELKRTVKVARRSTVDTLGEPAPEAPTSQRRRDGAQRWSHVRLGRVRRDQIDDVRRLEGSNDGFTRELDLRRRIGSESEAVHVDAIGVFAA